LSRSIRIANGICDAEDSRNVLWYRNRNFDNIACLTIERWQGSRTYRPKRRSSPCALRDSHYESPTRLHATWKGNDKSPVIASTVHNIPTGNICDFTSPGFHETEIGKGKGPPEIVTVNTPFELFVT
jgi:hypothetical protein